MAPHAPKRHPVLASLTGRHLNWRSHVVTYASRAWRATSVVTGVDLTDVVVSVSADVRVVDAEERDTP